LPQEKQRIGIIILGDSGIVVVTNLTERIAKVQKIDVTCRPGRKRRAVSGAESESLGGELIQRKKVQS
jgi:hypothetical protein